MIDLHMHSTYSDGTFSIEEICQKAKELGLKQIAITDHNILKGSVLASKISEVDFIVGTELSLDWKGNEIHLLAYFPKKSNYKHIQFVINEGESYKKIAIMEMLEKLEEMGIKIKLSELASFSKGIINRVHICMALMKHGYTKSIAEGFDKYVGEHCDAYVERKTISIHEGIEAIHQDGGLAVIAHPYEYVEDIGSIDDFLYDIMDEIDGIECFHPSATKNDSEHLVSIANKNNKLITGGSDFHGANKPDIQMDMMKVDEKYKINRDRFRR